MNFPKELKYAKSHEWVRVEGDVATIGISDYAQGELGDIVFVELPETGESVAKGEALGSIEAVKTVSDLNAPLSGEVTEVNVVLEDEPTLINSDCYKSGWILRIKIDNRSELDDLLDAEAYQEHIS
ncbi:MAG: glycine cleavage system protein GcvH [Candidatus Marinimicrobia bacterium]|nr:glycine cleavage system protein GcvH [Candidatus Neomarinimicrobiota bacterium]